MWHTVFAKLSDLAATLNFTPTRSGEITMSAQALEDFDVEDRARALVSIATKYDELHTVLTGSDRWMTDDRAEQALIAMSRPFAHPLIGVDVLHDLIRDLRDACNARGNYEVYGYFPDHLEPLFERSYTQEDADNALEHDIDVALFPLLRGSSFPCHECKRIKSEVIYWQVATYGMRCEQHRLVPVSDGAGVGLVAS